MTSWPPISRDDLKAAAGSAGFDTVFPLLVRRLIAETADGLVELDMPGGSGTAIGGFDGIVKATAASAFVPAGTSVWELSVGGGQTKADDDYNKRTTAPDGATTGAVTYVQALLVPWTKARAWATARTKEGRWLEVRGYNLDRIHAWLDTAPATTAWLSERLDKKMPGVRSLGGWWTDTWLPSTRVPLDAAIVLAGRQDAAGALVERLKSGQKWITLGGDLRPDEARAFVAAALASGSTAGGAEQYEARAIVVSETESLERLAAQAQPLVILLSNPALARELPASHPHQFIVSASSRSPADVDVPRMHRQVVEAQLKAGGLGSQEAARLATLARRSLQGLRRALAHQPGPLTPAWSESPGLTLRRLLLAGAWASDSPEDCRAVAKCAGQPYADVHERARDLSAGDDMPFLGQVDEIWHVVALEDAWTLLGGDLTADDLEAARLLAIEVLAEIDPVLELDHDERWRAGLRGVRRQFSSQLRLGIAQTLAIAATNTVVRGRRGITGAQWSQGIVRDLLARANADTTYRTWESLTDVLALLAEAAPAAFLDAMRGGLAGPMPLHTAMFQDTETDNGLGSGSAHSSFLHALETLAWSPALVDDVADVLIALASIDPGGRYSNRPLESLVEVLSSWSPNTTADIDHRIRMIERLARTHPVEGRRLLFELIPEGHGFQSAHPSPRFGDPLRPERPTHEDRLRVIATSTELLIAGLEEFPADYTTLIAKIGSLPRVQHDAFVDHLRDLGTQLEDEERRAQLFEALREKVARHEQYSDAAWALPAEMVADLVKARDALAPHDPVRRHAWLFKSDWVEPGDISPLGDTEAFETEILRRRAAAVGEVLANGVEEVARLASNTEYPGIVGRALAVHLPDLDEEMLGWLSANTSPGSGVAGGYFAHRLQGDGGEMRDRLLGLAPDSLTRARLLRFTGDPVRAWSLLEGLGLEVQEHYWQEFQYYGLGRRFSDVTQAFRAAWALLDVNRPAAALDLLLIYARDSSSLEAAEVVAAGLEKLLEMGVEDPEFRRLQSYHFERLFALLAQHRDDIGRQRVVNLEWHLFPALGFDADAPTLHKALVEDPSFFVELVTAVFKPDTKPDSDPEDPAELERRRSIASRAYEVFSSLHLCPGVGLDGSVDAAALRDFVVAVRLQLNDVDRLRAGDGKLGEVLAYGPPSADGSPVHEAIRDVLEEIRSDALDRGLSRGIYNKRGVQTRGVLDGGTNEWSLASSLREQAAAAAAWPRTRRLLDELAESYESEARSADDSAERRHQGLGW